MGTKTDPGEYDCYKKAEEDEPIFILRASDPLSPKLVRKWVSMSISRAPAHTQRNILKWIDAMKTAKAMEEWKLQKETSKDK